MEPEKAEPHPSKPVSPLGFRLNPLVLFPGMAASLMLLADYRQTTPVFCTEVGSGCAALKRSAFSHVGSVPLPAIGIAGLALLLLLGLLRGPRARQVHGLVGAVAALAALALFGVQVAKGQFCQFCLVVDAAALIAGCIGASRLTLGWDPPEAPGPRIARGLGFAALTGLTAAFALTKHAPVPTVVAEEIGKTPPDKLLVLDFLDFECPYCREAHQETKALYAEKHDQLRIVRKHVPLTMHLRAEPAARAALCGERLGQGEPMLERLFDTDPLDFNDGTFAKIAVSLGLDKAAFEQCMVDPALKTRLDADKATWRSVGAEGLPTVYLGTERFVGLVPAAQVRARLEAALAH